MSQSEDGFVGRAIVLPLINIFLWLSLWHLVPTSDITLVTCNLRLLWSNLTFTALHVIEPNFNQTEKSLLVLKVPDHTTRRSERKWSKREGVSVCKRKKCVHNRCKK